MDFSLLVIIALLMVPVGIFGICFVKALRKQPGFRRDHRQRSAVEYTGPERRCANRDICPLGLECRSGYCPLRKASTQMAIKNANKELT